MSHRAGCRFPNGSPTGLPPPLGMFGECFKVGSMNGQGLLQHDGRVRRRKLQFISDAAYTRHVLALQEVHGLSGDMQVSLSGCLPGWRSFGSHCITPRDGLPAPGAGGVAICVSPLIVSLCTSIDFHIIIPGRCLAATFTKGSYSFTVINLHNSNLSNFEVTTILGFLQDCRFWDTDHPTSSFSLLVGDMNFSAPGERRFLAGRPSSSLSSLSPSGLSVSPSPIFRSRWMRELSLWVELAQPFPTHFSAASESSSRIDRGWTTAKSAAILLLDVSSSVSISAEDNWMNGISDHAMVDYVFSSRPDKKRSAGAAPLDSHSYLQAPSFSRHPDQICGASGYFKRS